MGNVVSMANFLAERDGGGLAVTAAELGVLAADLADFVELAGSVLGASRLDAELAFTTSDGMSWLNDLYGPALELDDELRCWDWVRVGPLVLTFLAKQYESGATLLYSTNSRPAAASAQGSGRAQ